MSETLLSPSNVLLYGREIVDLQVVEPPPGAAPSAPLAPTGSGAPLDPPPPPPRLGNNNFLQAQLRAGWAWDGEGNMWVLDPAQAPRLARIYGFSYEGHYYDLPKPSIFLVHGPGSDPEAFRPDTASVPDARFSRAPADADRTGVAQSASSFSEDIRVWSYDKGDFSLRLDPDSGPLDQILLERCLGGGGAYGAGAHGAGAHGAGAYGAGAYGAGAHGRGPKGGGGD